jgi:hypothetical protein
MSERGEAGWNRWVGVDRIDMMDEMDEGTGSQQMKRKQQIRLRCAGTVGSGRRDIF